MLNSQNFKGIIANSVIHTWINLMFLNTFKKNYICRVSEASRSISKKSENRNKSFIESFTKNQNFDNSNQIIKSNSRNFSGKDIKNFILKNILTLPFPS